MNRFAFSSRRSIALAAAAAAAVAVWAVAANHPRHPAGGPGGAGMVVAIDPETGLLAAPTADQAASLRPKVLPGVDDMQGLVEIHHADGSVSVKDLSGRLRQWEVVRVGSDGAVEASCVEGSEQAAAVARDTVTPVAGAAEVK